MFKKHTLRALALILVTVMAVAAIAGCSASNPNPTVLKIGDINIGMSRYYSIFSSYKNMYESYGFYDVSTTEKLREFQDMIYGVLIDGYLPLYWANKAGVTLTDDEEAQAEASMSDELESNLKSYADDVSSSITDENAIREEEVKLFKKALKKSGWTYNGYLDMMLQNYREQLIMKKFMQSIYDEEVSVSEDDVLKHYNELITEQTAEYSETPSSYYDDYMKYVNGTTTVQPIVAPAGYRFCKHILIKFAAEGETKDVDAIVAEVQAKLDAGEDFDALVAEYGEDTGMQSEPYITTGYLVSNDILDKYYDGFGAAAMALEKIGDVSAPVKTTAGYHFIQYTSDVSTDPIAYDTISDALMQQMINDAQTASYNAHMETWKADTDIVKYYNRVSNIR